METIYYKTGSGDDGEAFSRAGGIIRSGGLVAFPTETVYGLGGNAYSSESSRKIYAAKGRPQDNPLIVHVARPEDASEFAVVNGAYEKLAAAFMPGPLTVILPKKPNMPDSTHRRTCYGGGALSVPSGGARPDRGGALSDRRAVG